MFQPLGRGARPTDCLPPARHRATLHRKADGVRHGRHRDRSVTGCSANTGPVFVGARAVVLFPSGIPAVSSSVATKDHRAATSPADARRIAEYGRGRDALGFRERVRGRRGTVRDVPRARRGRGCRRPDASAGSVIVPTQPIRQRRPARSERDAVRRYRPRFTVGSFRARTGPRPCRRRSPGPRRRAAPW